MSERWILKVKNGVKIVICPECGYKADYPDTYCNRCNQKLDAPDETVMIKKKWW